MSESVHAVFQVGGYSRRSLRTVGVIIPVVVPLGLFGALTADETPLSARIFTLLWAPGMLALAYQTSYLTVFNVELVDGELWIHSGRRTRCVAVRDITSIDQRGTRINTGNGAHYSIEVASNAWVQMLDCIRLVRPDLPIDRARPSRLRRGDSFERIA